VPPARPAHPKGAGQVTMHRNGRASEDAPDASAYRSGSDRFHLVRMHADAGQSPWCEGGWNSYDSLATARSAPISTSVLMKLHEIPSTGCRRPGGGHLSDDLGRAFSGGVLSARSAEKSRPQFDLVTGVD